MRFALFACALVLGGCYQTSSTTDAGGRTDAGPRPCEEPSVLVVLRSDYLPGVEVVSVVLEANDVVVGGRGVTSEDDLTSRFEVGSVCEVTPSTRILITLRDPAGLELVTRQMVVADPAATPEVIFLITR